MTEGSDVMRDTLSINEVHEGDALELMKRIPDGSADLIVIDPPYNVGIDDEWDKWETVEGYIDFMGGVFKQCERVLKDNGSFYFFHNDMKQVAELQTWLRKHTELNLRSFIVWDKGNWRAISWKNPSERSSLRSWFNTCEYVLFYTFQDGSGLEKIMLDVNNFRTLRDYFEGLRAAIGLSKRAIIEKVGHRADHCFRGNSTQWDLPTPETYSAILELPRDNSFKVREYESLREEYESLREEYENQRYTHNLDENHNNVWRYSTENKGENHPTQKPLSVIRRIIRTSSNESDVVLDCFLGSGTTAVAAIDTGRNFIGIERESEYAEIARQRIHDVKKAKEAD